MRIAVSRRTLERLPFYANCLEQLLQHGVQYVSSVKIANQLGLGEVQVRKELALVSGKGKPRIGYQTDKLLADIKKFLGKTAPTEAVIVGAGRLGKALLFYNNFDEVGVQIKVAFDTQQKSQQTILDKQLLPTCQFENYCKTHDVKIGIITVSEESAQSVCDAMLQAGIKAIWNFAPTTICVPNDVTVINEKLSLSLSQLRQQIIL